MKAIRRNKNCDIRGEIAAAGLRAYEVAKEIGMQDSNFSRMLRDELPAEKKEEIRAGIERLKRKMRFGNAI